MQAIWATHLGNYDLMILTETKIPNAVYYKNRMGYYIVCSRVFPAAPGGMQGFVGLLTRDIME